MPWATPRCLHNSFPPAMYVATMTITVRGRTLKSREAPIMDEKDKSLAGHFLVASRYLPDPNFVHSVVLMIHHTDEGAMGVVINRPSDKTVREVWDMIGYDPVERDDRIFVGGPVPGPLVCVH